MHLSANGSALLVPVLIASLSACAPLKYKEPTSGPRARVRFVTDSPGVTVLRTYGDSNCRTDEVEWMRLRDGPLFNSVSKRLGMPLWNYSDNAAKEVFVEADKPLNGMFYGSRVTTGWYTYSCAVPFAYAVERGLDYEVFFRWDPKACSVTVSRLIATTGEPRAEPLASFTNRLTPDNQSCMDAFKRKRWD